MIKLLLICCFAINIFFGLGIFYRGSRWIGTSIVLVSVAASFFVVSPELTNSIASLVGVGRGADLIVYALFTIFLFAMVFFVRSHLVLDEKITKLTRFIAMQNRRDFK